MSKLKRTGSIIWRVVFPFHAMKQTVLLTKKQIDLTIENASTIKKLWEKVTQKKKKHPPTKVQANQGFEAVIRNRSVHAPSEAELYQAFLNKKRKIIGVALLFLITNLASVLFGFYEQDHAQVLLGLLSCLASQPLFILLALSMQLRLWQLKTRRLSKAEKGGLHDFIQENPDWFLQTLNLELKHTK